MNRVVALGILAAAFPLVPSVAVQSAKATSQSVKSAGPSLRVTVAWLKENLPLMGSIRTEKRGFGDGSLARPRPYRLDIRNVVFEECTLEYEQNSGFGWGTPTRGGVSVFIHLGAVDLASFQVEPVEGDAVSNKGTSLYYEVILTERSVEERVAINTRANAERVAKAMARAATLCGARKSAF